MRINHTTSKYAYPTNLWVKVMACSSLLVKVPEWDSESISVAAFPTTPPEVEEEEEVKSEAVLASRMVTSLAST